MCCNEFLPPYCTNKKGALGNFKKFKNSLQHKCLATKAFKNSTIHCTAMRKSFFLQILMNKLFNEIKIFNK